MILRLNIWKLTIRSLFKHKRSTSLNIIGLAFGFAAVLFLGVYVHREFSYDNFHVDKHLIFKPEFEIIEAKADVDLASNLSLDQIQTFRDNVPGIEAITFLNYSRWDWDNGAWIEYDGNKYKLEKLAFSDKYFDKVFSFDVHSGHLSSSLDNTDQLVLTKDIADRIFGDLNPIGEQVLLNNKPVVIGAIINEIPSNSSIQLSGLVSYKSAKYFFGNPITDWSNIAFVKIKGNSIPVDVGYSMSSVMRNTLPADELKRLDPVFFTNLISLRDLYFHSLSPFDPIKHGSKSLSYIIFAIGMVILFLAIINYANLLLATSLKWKKDFGIQKVLGAKSNTERKQLFMRGFLITTVAFVGGILLLSMALPWLNQLINYPLQKSDFFNTQSFTIATGLLLFTIFFSGLIPILLNKNSTVLAQIKGNTISHKSNSGIWKSMITFQLFISISLIIAAIVITNQTIYNLNKDIGLNVKNVLTIPTSKLDNKQKAFIDEVADHAQTLSYCRSTSYINTFNIRGGKLKAPDMVEKGIVYTNIRVNSAFLTTLGLELIEGRNFSKTGDKDKGAMIVNQALVKEFGLSNPLEATIRGYPIIGVVKDFNFNSLRYKIEPVVLFNTPDRVGMLTLLFSATTKADIKNYMTFLGREWKNVAVDEPFDFEFVDDRLAAMYKEDIILAKTVISFSLLAIFIACLGIFGLLAYIMEIRIKEIGIRKVNGARIIEILQLVNNDLLKWISIAFVLACPITYFIMNKWLENFAYKTSISWWIFALAGVLALFVSLLTVSWQSWKAATRNPVEALRYE